MRPRAQQQLKKIGQADLVIGLPSYKNPIAAAHVARIALAGTHQYCPHLRTVLVNADAGYKAITRRAVAAQASTNGRNSNKVVTGRYDGLLGRGSAVAALLDAGLALDAKAIIILDSHTLSITPSWIAGLANLILEEKADLVMPRYHWSMPGGGLSDLIAYPLFRALWGRSVRHPAAPDFALSPRLATALLDEDVWETEVAAWGLTPWLTTYATLGQWRVAQSALGEKQTFQTIEEPQSQIASRTLFEAQFQNVVSTLLRSVYAYRSYWDEVSSFHSYSTLTQFAPETQPAPAPEEDPTPLLDALALGWIEYRSLWQRVLTSGNLAQIEALAALRPDQFYFPADLWARIVYDFVVVFNKGDCDPYQVSQSLFPLYQGRLAAFRQEIAGLALAGREGTVAAQAVEFEEARSYLKQRWQLYPPWLDNSNISDHLSWL